MSHAATKWAFDQPEVHRDMKPSEWAVLMVLADCHNPVNGCFPSQDYICSKTNLSDRAVRNQLGKLRERKLVAWEAAREEGRRGSNRYSLSFEEDFLPANPAGSQPEESAGSSTGKIEHEQPANFDQSNRQNLPTNPVREPVREPVDETAREVSSAEEGQLRQAAGASINAAHPNLLVMATPLRWKAAGMDWAADVLPAIRAASARSPPGRVRSWDYFTEAIADYHKTRTAPMPQGNPRTANGRRTTTGDLARTLAAEAREREAEHDVGYSLQAPRQLPGT